MTQPFPEFRASGVTSPALGNSFDGAIYTEYDNFLRQVGFFSVPSGAVSSPVPVQMPAGRVVAGPPHNPLQMPAGQPHNHRNVGALGPTQLVMHYAAGTSRAPTPVGMGHIGSPPPIRHIGSPPPMPPSGGLPAGPPYHHWSLGAHIVSPPPSTCGPPAGPPHHWSLSAIQTPAVVQTPAEICGVGIKFGERLDSTGKITVYVKRILQGGPAHAKGGINLGDVLVRLDGEDISGSGLNFLRTRIPGPANSFVKLGFQGPGGEYEALLCRTAYGSNPQAYQAQPQSSTPSNTPRYAPQQHAPQPHVNFQTQPQVVKYQTPPQRVVSQMQMQHVQQPVLPSNAIQDVPYNVFHANMPPPLWRAPHSPQPNFPMLYVQPHKGNQQVNLLLMNVFQIDIQRE